MSKVYKYSNKAYGINNFEMDLYWANIYQSLFRSMAHKFDLLFNFLNDEFIVASRKVNKYSKVARQVRAEEKIDGDMQLKLDHAIRAFDKIGIDLQYHDIIRQKVEHIYVFEKKISQELEAAFNFEDEFHPKSTLVLNEMVELFVNQLMKIKSDYLTATSNIQRSLFYLWSDRNLARKLKLLLFSTSSQLKNITRTLDEIILTHQKLAQKGLEYRIDIHEDMRINLLLKVKAIYTMQEERDIFNETFMLRENAEPAVTGFDDDFDDILF